VNNILKDHRLILFLILSVLILVGWFDERIPSNNETGWDGKHYAHYVIDLPHQVMNGEIDSYHFYRLMPCFIVYLLLKLFHYDPNSVNVVHAFLALNTLLILLSALYYFVLCNHLKVTKHAETIGFAGLFFNFVILKNSFYYPVLTDVFAFAFGFFVVGEFIRKKWMSTFFAFILGIFTYPLFFVSSFVFLIRSKSNLIETCISKIFPLIKYILPIFLSFALYIYFIFGKQLIFNEYFFNLSKPWLIIGFPMMLVYIYKIFNVKFSFHQNSLNKFNEVKIIFLIIALFSSYFLINHYVRTIAIPEDDFTSSTFLWIIFQQSIAKPFSFLIAHFTYFGPIILLMLFYYKKMIAEIPQFGWQLFVFIFIYLILGIGSESRQFMNAYPAFVMLLVMTINQINFNKKVVIGFVLISLFQSHFWLQINRPKIYESYIYDKFPEQYYFMHHGPFASDTSYLINAAIFIFFILLFGFVIKKQNLNPRILRYAEPVSASYTPDSETSLPVR